MYRQPDSLLNFRKNKNVFESKEIAGKIQINIASFEKWYANQIKYHKVTREEPGKELKS